MPPGGRRGKTRRPRATNARTCLPGLLGKLILRSSIMNTYALIVAALIAMPIGLTGCDRTVSETTRTHSDAAGNVSKESKTVKEDPAGNVTVTKEQSTNKVVDTH